MTPEQMLDLKDGDQVVLNQTRRLYEDVPAGTILTRKKEWLDDPQCVKFTYEVNGHEQYHFFTASEIDFIKE